MAPLLSRRFYRKAGKRALDILMVIPLLIIMGPFIGSVAVIVLLLTGKPILFRQLRPGIDGVSFVIYKFRTMTTETAEIESPLPDRLRIHTLGILLRKLSFDELPELWNILKGDMSFIGPRPLLMEYLFLYTPEQARRHEVKPGITGWAQVNGRNAIGWEEKFRLDVWYVDNLSLWLDFKILWMTLIKVIRMEAINQPGSATMEKFQGSGGKHGGQILEMENAQNQRTKTDQVQLDGPTQG